MRLLFWPAKLLLWRDGLLVLILAVHSTTARLAVAVTQDGRVLIERILPPSREHMENIAILIRRIAEMVEIELGEFDGFGAAIGPGSFSGIRVGLAVMKGLAFALKKPVFGISSLEILARQAFDDGRSTLPVIDARRKEVFTAVYQKSGNRMVLSEGPHLTGSVGFLEILDRTPGPVVVCGDRVMDSLVESRPNVFRSIVEEPLPSVCAVLTEECIRRGEPGNVHGLTPLYVRRSDAEEKRFRTVG
jgi:tRNA threonylcarbamoyladenosine biosynthesis protein TsaB